MQDILLFGLLGLGEGALIAGVALALIVTYKGSGTINLATGATAMVGAYAFWALRTGQVGPELGGTAALVIALLVAVCFGAITEFGVFRPLRTAPPLAKVVASLGLVLVAQAVVILAFSSDPQSPPAILPVGTVSVLGTDVPVDRFLLGGIVIAAGAGCWALYRFTSFGLATRAAADNEFNGVLAGLSPDRLALANTLLGSLAAGGLGILAASVIGLDPQSLPLLVVPALAAALLADFRSIPIAVAVGLGIGVLISEFDYAQTQSWYPVSEGSPVPGLADVAIFLIVALALYWRGSHLPGRGQVLEQRLPFAPRPQHTGRWAVLALVGGAVALVVLPYDFRQALTTSMVGTVLILSLVVITGYLGQVSAVQLALSGVAGFGLSHLAADAGIGFPWAALIAIAGTTVIGVGVAVSALRVRGVNLVVVTLAAAVAFQNFLFANPSWGGTSPVPEPHLFGIDLGARAGFRGLDGKLPSPILGFVILAVTVALCLMVANLRRTALGQRMLAIRANERAAAATGVNVRAVKLWAAAIASFLAGAAGVLYAYDFGTVSASRFGPIAALGIISFAFLGGITSVAGAVLAGFMTTEALFPHILSTWVLPEGQVGTYTLLFGGLALIITLIINPDGIEGARYQKRMAKRHARDAAPPPPPPAPPARGRPLQAPVEVQAEVVR